eukprot:6641306-Prymnesium_polylepis.1
MAVPQSHPSAEEESGEADEENEDEAQPNADGSDQAVVPPSQPPTGIDVDAALQQAVDHARGHEGLLSVSVSIDRSEVRADGTVLNYSKSANVDLKQAERSDPPKLPDLPEAPQNDDKHGKSGRKRPVSWKHRRSELVAIGNNNGFEVLTTEEDWLQQCTGNTWKPICKCIQCGLLVGSTNINHLARRKSLGCICNSNQLKHWRARRSEIVAIGKKRGFDVVATESEWHEQ